MERSTIDQIEQMLNGDEPPPIRILPDGTIHILDEAELEEQRMEHPKTPLTFRQHLGGEY